MRHAKVSVGREKVVSGKALWMEYSLGCCLTKGGGGPADTSECLGRVCVWVGVLSQL